MPARQSELDHVFGIVLHDGVALWDVLIQARLDREGMWLGYITFFVTSSDEFYVDPHPVRAYSRAELVTQVRNMPDDELITRLQRAISNS